MVHFHYLECRFGAMVQRKGTLDGGLAICEAACDCSFGDKGFRTLADSPPSATGRVQNGILLVGWAVKSKSHMTT